MKSYAFDEGEVDIKLLESSLMNIEDFAKAHQSLVIPCHDIVIEYNGGLLLVVRDNLPAKDVLWPVGGRILRGMDTINSLRRKVKEECNLEIHSVTELGICRTFFRTDPFGHGKGTDTICVMYYGKGSGDLKLDNLHKQPTIVRPEDYIGLRERLHPYVRKIMDLGMGMMGKGL